MAPCFCATSQNEIVSNGNTPSWAIIREFAQLTFSNILNFLQFQGKASCDLSICSILEKVVGGKKKTKSCTFASMASWQCWMGYCTQVIKTSAQCYCFGIRHKFFWKLQKWLHNIKLPFRLEHQINFQSPVLKKFNNIKLKNTNFQANHDPHILDSNPPGSLLCPWQKIRQHCGLIIHE